MSALVNWLNSLDHSLLIPREKNEKLKGIFWRMTGEDEGERLLSLLQMLIKIWKNEGKRASGHFEEEREDEAVKRVVNYIHCNYNREITIKQLAVQRHESLHTIQAEDPADHHAICDGLTDGHGEIVAQARRQDHRGGMLRMWFPRCALFQPSFQETHRHEPEGI